MTAVFARRTSIFQDAEIQKVDGNVDIARTGDYLKKEGPQGPKRKYEYIDLGKAN